MPVGQRFSYGYAGDMAKNCPRYVKDMPDMRIAQALPGRVHQLEHYVTVEVRDAVGHHVVGTFCLLTLPIMHYSSCRLKVGISKVLPHENFRATANDIALLKLGISLHMIFFASKRLQAVILHHLFL